MCTVLLGCSSSLDARLDGKACSARGECLAGFVCSADGRCVRPEVASDSAADAVGSTPELEQDASAPLRVGTQTSAVIASDAAFDAQPEDGMPAGCAAPAMSCGQSCVDVASNPDHCGRCDLRCEAPPNAEPACVHGSCDYVCGTSFVRCGAACIHVERDVADCGACGAACPHLGPLTALCDAGSCTPLCKPGKVACNGACVDLAKDHFNCGQCGRVCAGKCDRGACDPHGGQGQG